MRVAVTGGAGQLGTAVLHRLVLDRAIKELRVLDLRPHAVASPKIRFHQTDVRDPEIRKHFEGCDALVHLAFIVASNPGRSTFFGVNVEGSKNVFEAAAAAGVARIVYSSSIAAYGVGAQHPVPIVEDTPRVHVEDFAYSSAKFQVEAFLDTFEARHPQLAIVRLRPAIIVGPYMDHDITRLFRKGQAPDTGAQPLPLVWDEDVAEAIDLALHSDVRGAFNLAAEDAKTGRELADAAGLTLVRRPAWLLGAMYTWLRLLNRLGIATALDPAWLRPPKVAMIIDSAKARDALNWQPKKGTAAAIARGLKDLGPGALDKRIRQFFRLVQTAAKWAPIDEAQRRTTITIHLAFTGPNGGDLGLMIHEGKLTVSNEIPRPPAAKVTMDTAFFLDLLAGKADYASASLTGKIRTAGEPMAGLVVQAIVQTFRHNVTTGKSNLVTRYLARRFLKGA